MQPKKNIDKLKHPNSRKTVSLIKKVKRNEKKGQNKLVTHIKQNLIGEKLLWFKERLPKECVTLDKDQILRLIEAYLARFDEEVQQIHLKNSVGQRKGKQHCARLDVINMTQQREREEFEGAGLELPDLGDSAQLATLRTWSGELRYLQNFKFKRYPRNHLI